MAENKVLENGVLAWIPAGSKGVRIDGWENKVANIPEDQTSDYATLSVYILDDIDPRANIGAQGTAAQLKHAQWCNNMRDTFNDVVADSRVHSIRMQHGQRSRHVLERIEAELQDKTADDLVVFCFQGTAGDDGDRYTFNLTGPGPNSVNAHKLITKANESSADVLFILDCWFPTHSIKQWRRANHMTEIMLAGREMHDSGGRAMPGPENFHEVFSSAMRDILAHPRGGPRQTIPRILCRDKTLCSKPKRHWIHKPDRNHPERRVWRIFVDIGRLGTEDEDEKLQLRRCNVTGRRRGEFGGDPELENYGWGPDDSDEDDDEDDDEDGGSDGEGDGHHAGNEGGQDGDGDSSNGGWGRGFGRSRRRTPPRRENEENEDGAGVKDNNKDNVNGNKDNVNGNGDIVAKLYAQLKRALSIPIKSKLNNVEAINLVNRLDSLPKHLKRRKRLSDQAQQELPTPPSGGIRKRAGEKRPLSVNAEVRARSEVAPKPRRSSPSDSDCEITYVRGFGHELGNPIDLSGTTGTIESSAPPSARRDRVIDWLGNFLPKSLQNPLKEEADDDEAIIKRSGSPAPRAGEGSPFGGRNAAHLEMSLESDLEITFEGPVNRPFGGGDLIDLTDLPIDLTGELDSLFIPEQTDRDGGHKTAGSKKKSQSSLFSSN